MANTIEIVITGKNETGGMFGGVQDALGGLGNVLKGAVVGAAGLAAAGFTALGGAVAYAVAEATEAELGQAQLAAVLESTGGAAGVTAEMANDLASALSGVTRYSDDAVLGAENMLLTFTSIGKEVFPDALETVLDMSTAMGQDLKSSSIQLGKALNDPIAGVGALSRVGVQFTEDQKLMIEELVNSGDLLGAQTIILEELQREFGGAAEAAGGTFAGQLDIMRNSLANVAEEAGTQLLPILTAGIQQLTPIIIELATRFSEFVQSDQFKAWVSEVVRVLTEVGAWLAVNLPPAIAALANYWTTVLVPALQQAWAFFNAQILPILQQVFNWLATNLPPAIQTLADYWTNTLYPALQVVWAFLQDNIFPLLGAVANVMGAILGKEIEALAGLWQDVLYPAIRDYVLPILQDAFDWFNKVTGGIQGITGAIQSAINWLKQLAIKIAELELPDWLTPGSPTPFETGLRGVADAMRDISTIEAPRFGMALATAGMGNGTVNNNYNLTIHSNARTEQVTGDFEIMRAMA